MRSELATPAATRTGTREPLLAFFAFGDMHIADEESPFRTEFADACNTDATTGSFRPHETMLPQLAAAHASGARLLQTTGSPATRKAYDFAVRLGDATDNAQLNEMRWAMSVLDGGNVDPDSGAEGYEGAQARDPRGARPFTGSNASRIRELANEPFSPPGLAVPWYAVLGSHDVKPQGVIGEEDARSLAQAIATGPLKLGALEPEERARICKNPSLLSNPETLQRLLTQSDPGVPKVVAADPSRRFVTRAEWIAEHAKPRGLMQRPAIAGARCTGADGRTLPRACYAWDQGPFRMIALDTVSPGPGREGNVDAAQFAWLERELQAASSKYYDGDGDRKQGAGPDRLVIVFSHHPTEALTNDARDESHDGKDLEALLLRFPNVVLHVNAYTHRDRVLAHQDDAKSTSYWELTVGSTADKASRSRSIEVVDNHDGTLSVFAVQFEANAPPDPRGHEQWGVEKWLASAAREIAFHDPQAPSGMAPARARNVELVVPHPLGVTRPGTVNPPPTQIPGSFGLPRLPGNLLPPNFPGGFPGGLPKNFGQPPFQFPFPNQQPPISPVMPTTERGLGSPSDSNVAMTRTLLLFLSAAAGAYWLLQARVRRWMVGI